MDSIVKALTIQITADDLTGGAWSKVGEGIKTVYNAATQLNQAWEFGAKIYDKVTAALEAPIQMLSEGGEYSEAAAGFEALAESYGRNGPLIRDQIRDISEGTMGLKDATQAASAAMKYGFSAEQTQYIWEFAKKYSDVMGGSFQEVAATIEKALFTGKTKSLGEFGLMIKAGQDMDAVMAQLIAKTKAMGEGQFNFGDAWTGMGQSVADAALAIKAALNDLVGESGFETVADGFRAMMRSIEEDAGFIADAIFIPIKDTAKAAYDWLVGPASLSKALVDLFDIGFENTDSFQTVVETMMRAIGNTFYDLANVAGTLFNVVISPVEGFLKLLAASMEKIMEFNLKFVEMSESLFGKSANLDELRKDSLEMRDTMAELWNGNIVALDTGKIDKARSAYNDALDKTAESHKKVTEAAKDAGKHIEKVGEAFGKAEKAAKPHQDAIAKTKDTVKEMTDAYKDMGKAIGDSIKVIGDVMNTTQAGINTMQGTATSFIAGAYDPFSITSGMKVDEMEKLINNARKDKDKEREILEKQAEAQRELASAMREYASKPKVVQFQSPDNPNTTEAFIKTVIDHLVREAKAEGTMVQA